MEKSFTTKAAKEWLDVAERDFIAAQSLLDLSIEPVMGAVCFHCQQCIEKMLKAVLAFHNQKIPKTHDLMYLSELILPLCPGWEADLRELSFLTDATVDYRYPGDPAGLEEAEYAFQSCSELRRKLYTYLRKPGE